MKTPIERNYYVTKKIIFRETLEGNICRVFLINPIDLFGKDRDRNIIYARHLYRYFIKKHTSYSLAKLGEMSGCGHSNVINSVKVVENLVATDKSFREKFESIEKLISQNLILMPKRK